MINPGIPCGQVSLLLVSLVSLLISAPALADSPAILGYVETLHGGAEIGDLDLGPLTHVIDAFVLPDREGRLRPVGGLPRTDLVQRCHTENRLVLVSIGGGTVPGEVFSAIAGRSSVLDRFATGAVKFAMDAGYDGLDIDWEFPEPDQQALYVNLVARVRQAMIQAEWKTSQGSPALLCIGVSTGYWLNGYDFAALSPLTDFAIYFGYDFRNPALGPWMHYDMMWPKDASVPMEASVSAVVAEIARRGYAPGKILVGLPFYSSLGRPWTTVRKTTGLAEASLHPVFLEKNVRGEWINDAEAIRAKAGAALAPTVAAGRAAGGIAVWQIGHQGRFQELTNALAQALTAMNTTRPSVRAGGVIQEVKQ